MTRFVKRLLDLVVSVLAIAVLWPLMLLIAMLILVLMGRPVIFKQRRPGLNERAFCVYKFRSMRNGDGSDEQRLTRFGALLRATSLDELPEFWNVFRGDMSLVGPRPLLMDYLGHYSAEQSKRHRVRPGLTGWAQIKGRNDLSWDDKLKLDVWYVENCSLWLDVKILIATPFVVLRQQGVNKTDHATTDRFTESES
mgnify:CR=1 FL=1